jgi:hypothetical protein
MIISLSSLICSFSTHLFITSAIISSDTSSLIEMTFSPEDVPPFNKLFVLFDDIDGLEESLDCSVLMNRLGGGMNIQLLNRS